MNKSQTTIIVGAGQAGARTAEALRRDGYQDRIVLIGAEAHAPYERPPLSKDVLSGHALDGKVFLRSDDFWQTNGIEFERNVTVAAIDRTARTISTQDGRQRAYDNLVLATGTRPRQLPAFDGQPPCFYLRTLDDARDIRTAVIPGSHVLIVGAGVIGLEVAATLVNLGAGVTIIEATGGVMGRSVPPTISAFLIDPHEARGVDIRLNTTVEHVGRDSSSLTVTLNDDKTLRPDVVIIGIGVVPNSELAAQAGLIAQNGIVVNEHGQTSDPTIYAVGDVAYHPIGPDARMGRQETWRHAENHPRTIAASILRKPAPYRDVPGFWSDQFEFRLQGEGTLAGAEILRRPTDGATITAFYIAQDGRLVGAAGVNDAKTLGFARRLIASGARISPAELADPAFDLRSALRRAPAASMS